MKRNTVRMIVAQEIEYLLERVGNLEKDVRGLEQHLEVFGGDRHTTTYIPSRPPKTPTPEA